MISSRTVPSLVIWSEKILVQNIDKQMYYLKISQRSWTLMVIVRWIHTKNPLFNKYLHVDDRLNTLFIILIFIKKWHKGEQILSASSKWNILCWAHLIELDSVESWNLIFWFSGGTVDNVKEVCNCDAVIADLQISVRAFVYDNFIRLIHFNRLYRL